MSRIQCQQPRLLDHYACLCNALHCHALLSHRLTEGDAGEAAFAHALQCAFCQTDLAHAMVNATRAKSTLGNFETSAFA